MGLFDWLFGKKSGVPQDDTIWLTRRAKLEGIREAVLGHLAPDAWVLLTAHFPATLAEVRQHLDAAGDRYTVWEGRAGPRPRGGEVVVGLAGALAASSPDGPDADIPLSTSVIVAERHPLRANDDALVAFAAGLPPPRRVTFHLSLEDPLLRVFSGEWVGDVLRRLGMQEDEAIRSPMVARRIVAAQKKIAKIAFPDRPADSAEDWVRLNCPELLPEQP